MSWPKEMQPGGFFDITSISGNIKGILLGAVCFLIFWYSYEIFTWLDGMLEIERKFRSEDRVSYRKMLAVFLGGGTMLVFFICLLNVIFNKNVLKSGK